MTSTTRGVELAGVTLGGLHEVLAEPGPGPAGGSAAALATTMAAGRFHTGMGGCRVGRPTAGGGCGG